MARIFLCHASEDKAQVREVYHRLRAIDGFAPWLDEEDLLPGQDWDYEIKKALKASDFILIFLSRSSVAKRGYVQREMKLALDAWQELPEGTIHTIPVRLDDCDVPESFRRYHWANLFEPNGFDRIVCAIRTELAKRPGTTSQPILPSPPRTSHSESPVTTDTPVVSLTSREREILRCVAEGQTTKEIAAHLRVSIKIVESHRINIMRKLGIHETASFVRYAIRQGLTTP